ncbi:head-tail connector protein [Metabacillus sp. 22489]|uniref:head-tail connector protein n=1 Tax=Metabacillus sp. 22489 TaxID=3453928 RepID=UPI003F853D93
MIIELKETKEWLRIDGDDEDTTLKVLIGAAENYLKNATGHEFDQTYNQAKLFCFVLVTDWYENRELIGNKPSEKVRFTIQSMLTQLQNITFEGEETSGI